MTWQNVNCVLMIYCGLNNITFKIFLKEHIMQLNSEKFYMSIKIAYGKLCQLFE